MKYRELHGYKYLLEEDETFLVSWIKHSISHPHITVENGIMVVKKGYAWDGPSGPTIDDKTNIRASLIHDALYQLMRESWLSVVSYRKLADEELRFYMRKDGFKMLRKTNKDTWFNRQWVKFRADYYYKAVRIFGAKTCLPEASPRGKIVEI